jgi:hypothetical protein
LFRSYTPPPTSPPYIFPSEDNHLPFVLGDVSGDVFDDDPPSPGGTPSKRNGVFTPRPPPPYQSFRREHGSPSPMMRKPRGTLAARTFAGDRGGGGDEGHDSEEATTEAEYEPSEDSAHGEDVGYQADWDSAEEEEETEAENEPAGEHAPEGGDEEEIETEGGPALEIVLEVPFPVGDETDTEPPTVVIALTDTE